jgi:hypothetical protein
MGQEAHISTHSPNKAEFFSDSGDWIRLPGTRSAEPFTSIDEATKRTDWVSGFAVLATTVATRNFTRPRRLEAYRLGKGRGK